MAKNDGILRPKVSSSAINRVSWNPANGRLSVTFKGNRTYTYDGVTRQRYNAMLKSSSLGRYISKNLKPALGKSVAKVAPKRGALARAMTRVATSRQGSSTSGS